MTTDVSKRYDEVPYESNAFHHSHPLWLATIATLFGMKPPAPEGARILEIGCASGGNLVPMAESLPQSACLGIDISQRQIEAGHKFVAETGLTNVELRQASILDIDDSYGKFDYIVCHGVFSWVERHVQQKILQICGERLSPQGIAYVSYNTYPGWHMKGMLRDMMKFHAGRFNSPGRQIEQSRALLQVLAKTIPSNDNPYGLLLKQESERLARCSDWYIYHEQLAESELRAMLTNQLPADIQAALREVGTSIIYAEQYLDFFRNRTFRKSLLCRSDIPVNRNLNPDSFKNLYFASELAPKDPIADISQCSSVVFEHAGWPTITARKPIPIAALLCLSEAWPTYVSALELERQVRVRLSLPPPTEQTSHEFADQLGSWYTTGVVKTLLRSGPHTNAVGPQPVASRVARAQARMGKSPVANLLHHNVVLSPFDAFVLTLLDGSLDRSAIVARVAEYIRTQKDTAAQSADGSSTIAEAHDVEALDSRVQSTLVSLARMAFLLA
jgi:methyltransferase-like protein/ubiquinone/menaquinone biosynthesis C-methylase UbiE